MGIIFYCIINFNAHVIYGVFAICEILSLIVSNIFNIRYFHMKFVRVACPYNQYLLMC